MLAELITIGDEILIGQIVDSNSSWMAQRLNAIGVAVKQITSVSDQRDHILKALAEAATRAEVILMTGGLGPTKDDITKKTLAEYFGVGMRRDAPSLENIERIFKKYTNRPMLDVNRAQADVPENCEVLLNEQGTAPGMWFEHQNRIYVSMPGVPYEMNWLMDTHVLPRIRERFALPHILHKTILTAGLGESFLAQQIEDIENTLPQHIRLAYLPNLGQVRLRLSASGADATDLQNEVDFFARQIIEKLDTYIVAEEDIPLEVAIMKMLGEKGFTLSVAESCTGGYLSHLFTRHAGSSEVFQGGAVTYANTLKQLVLGVKNETLNEFGAVSEQTVREMADGARKNFYTSYAVAVSGIAGPGGGTPEKPVGTVWIAVSGPEKTVSRQFSFSNKRTQNIERSAVSALTLLFQMLNGRL
ncbi:MAG: competence/damage-inducible protein A [Mucilaginibacter polytrichastri]|nr:competence/damage-inducible protein A [Mucilaginibacter polytrichastri]